VFVIAIALQVVLPMLPLAAEMARRGELADRSLVVTVPFLALTMGTSAKHPVLFVLGLVEGVALLLLWGAGLDFGAADKLTRTQHWALFVVCGATVAAFGYDRWRVHTDPPFEPFGLFKPEQPRP
jgi:hypothetical protein